MKKAEIAELIRSLSVGVYGIGVKSGNEIRIFTASWVMPVSFNPLLIVISVNPLNRSYGMMISEGCFTVNVLGQNHSELAQKLADRGDRLKGLSWSQSRLIGCPILDDALAHLECNIQSEYPAGDHQLLVAEVITGSLRNPLALPMLYADTGNTDGSIALLPGQLAGGTE